MRKKIWLIFFVIGILFLLNAIFGRYLVLPGYLSSLEEGRTTLDAVRKTIPTWKIVRYLLWAYSFKLGIFLLVISALLKSALSKGRLFILIAGGIVYLILAYVPFPGPYSLFFGLSGGLITVLLVFIFMGWANERNQLGDSEKSATDYRLIGYFFFAMATYNLCPLLGVRAFGLYPEKMVQYGLQADAVSFASRIMIELLLGWVFIFLSYRRSPKVSVSS